MENKSPPPRQDLVKDIELYRGQKESIAAHIRRLCFFHYYAKPVRETFAGLRSIYCRKEIVLQARIK